LPHEPVGVQPHTFEAPQVIPAAHVPHGSIPPQPSGMAPQFLWSAAQVVGVQPQTRGVPPPPQVSGAVQLPQGMRPPQPSSTVPQLLVPHEPVGTQPQTLAALQVMPAAHVPQSSIPPQPSETCPQFLPSAEQVYGAQPPPSGESGAPSPDSEIALPSGVVSLGPTPVASSLPPSGAGT
jgi:hypothetical protein